MDPADFDLYRALMSADELPDVTLADLLHRPAWQESAACRGMGVEVFFPTRGDDMSTAKAVCAACQVQDECLAYAVDLTPVPHGVWAGFGHRRRLTMRPPRPVVTTCSHCGDDGAGADSGLCTPCRHYRWKYDRLPGPDALAIRAQRRARAS